MNNDVIPDIFRHIKAGNMLCLANCGAHEYITMPRGDDTHGGLSFSVILNDEEPRMIHIFRKVLGMYDVSLTRLSKDGQIIAEGEAVCEDEELANTITDLCMHQSLACGYQQQP